MLRHTGHQRSHLHDLKLASLLSLTAGFVNGAGFLAFNVLTTNVTGHVALFAGRLAKGDYSTARLVALWIFLFLLGAFVSSLMINKAGRNRRYAYVAPILTEIGILIFIAVYGYRFNRTLPSTELFAGSLLFAMGLQNAMVTMISGSIVRTTHLTGMFTDLGIELSSWIYSRKADNTVIRQKISLHTVIIGFFIAGGISGAYLFSSLAYHTFFLPAAILIIAMFYDIFRIHTVKMARRIRRRISVRNSGTA